ncbi:MAG: Gx transporter family protein [Spirochaetes bacterium]|nr:Gx transporter family protein [Spirochaetota bacterium]
MTERSTRSSDNLARVTAFLGAVALFLSAVEYMVPKPLPFMRLGIANLPLLVAVDVLPFGWFLVLALVKVFGMSVVSGSLFSYVALFSLAGTMASALSMYGSRILLRNAVSPLGIAVIGATASNLVQLALAAVFVFGASAILTAPFFLGSGLATGIALGLFACRFERDSLLFALIREDARAR